MPSVPGFDVDRYLHRIGQARPKVADARFLAELQVGHLKSVPFENLDIHFGRPIDLAPEALFDKVVHRGRGGFCYELNGLFSRLLLELGYDVTLLSCRVYNNEGVLGPEHDHLALWVEAEGAWLVDVGFGDAFIKPLDLQVRTPVEQAGRAYRVIEHEDQWTYSLCKPGGEWVNQYEFTRTPRSMATFDEMCQYHQTAPESHFTQKRVISQLTDEGRVTLRDRVLIRTIHGRRVESVIEDESAWHAALKDWFGIGL